MIGFRNKEGSKIKGIGTIADLVYNEGAGANKVISNILGDLSILGAANTAKFLGKGALVALFNNTASVKLAAFGALGVSAPTDCTNGIALKPYDYTILNSGDSEYVISDSADVFAYQIKDETIIAPQMR